MVLAAAVACAACGGDAGSATEFEESPSSIQVDVARGNITIIGNAAVAGTSIEAEIRDGDPTPTYDLADGALMISDECGTDEGCRADYRVSIAGDADVTVATADGNVALTDLAGGVSLDITQGDVTLSSVSGDMQVVIEEGNVLGTRLIADSATFETQRGDLDVTFDDPVTTLVVASDDGDITVQLPDAAYTFETTAPNGAVDLALDNDPAATNQVTLDAGNGNITVYRR
jgi:hypothetical protein